MSKIIWMKNITSSALINLKNLLGRSLEEALEITTNSKQVIISFNAYVSLFTRLTK
jgi:hypothetical protein